MTLGPILAGALAPLTTRPWALYVGNLDVLKEPATPSRYGVPIDSLRLRKILWDGVGSLSFTIDNPSLVLNETSVLPGMEVRLAEYRSGTTYPWFTGYATRVRWVTDFGEQGNRAEVTCASIDVLLDWLITASDLTFPAASTFSDVFLGCLANVQGGHPELRAFGADADASTSDLPVGGGGGFGLNVGALTIPAGTTIRECARRAMGVLMDVRTGIDEYRGVRTKLVWDPTAGGDLNDPWPLFASMYGETPGTITIPGGPAKAPARTVKEYDGLAGVRSVAVTHPTLNTETLGDGSGLAGPAARVPSLAYPAETQPNVASEAVRYLYMNGFPSRGELTLEAIRGAGWNLRPASFTVSPMSLTLAALGQSAGALDMTSVEVRFHAGGEDYDLTVSYGITPTPSGAQKLRSLTRNTD